MLDDSHKVITHRACVYLTDAAVVCLVYYKLICFCWGRSCIFSFLIYILQALNQTIPTLDHCFIFP